MQAQVSSLPLRSPTPITISDGSAPLASEEYTRLDESKISPVTTQLNHMLSEIIASLDRTSSWMISCTGEVEVPREGAGAVDAHS